MSIPDIVLEDLYRRIRELEEAVRKLQKGQQVYGLTSPPPVPFPPVVTLPYRHSPLPVWSGAEASDCIYERSAQSGEPFAGICMCPKHSFRSKIKGVPPAPATTQKVGPARGYWVDDVELRSSNE